LGNCSALPAQYQELGVKSKIYQDIQVFLNQDRQQAETVFLRSEFTLALPQYSRTGIDRALRQMVDEGKMVRLGYGILAKARPSIFDGKPVLGKGPYACAIEALNKLGVPWQQDSATRAYNENRTTQIPTWIAFDIAKPGFTRKINFNGKEVFYERSFRV
jgi:hypothetical protein